MATDSADSDVDGGLAVKTFTEKILDLDVLFYVLRMRQSFVLWIGTEPRLEMLSVAMPTRFVSILPSSLDTKEHGA